MSLNIPPELRHDKRLWAHIRSFGPLNRDSWNSPKNIFGALLRSIIHQQVSGAAAENILKRLMSLFHGKMPTPKQILETSERQLRSAGLSRSKISYARDLADHVFTGKIKTALLRNMTNDEIVNVLTQVKGIGVWTAHMFLIFTIKRPDILPTLDLGIRKGFQIVYRLKRLPDHIEMEKLAKPWRAHATLASLYLWKAADSQKKPPPRKR